MNPATPILQGDSYPNLCLSVGLSCETCTQNTARQVAKVCKGLRGSMITRLFVQIYPDTACGKMAMHFSEEYRKASPIALSQPIEDLTKLSRDLTREAPMREAARAAAALVA